MRSGDNTDRLAVLLAAGVASTHLEILVLTAAGNWHSLRDPMSNGIDFIDSLSYGGDIDKLTAEAKLTLIRRFENFNLAPFDDDSAINAQVGVLVDIGLYFRVFTASIAVDVQPTPYDPSTPGVMAADWSKVFQGYMDEVDWAKELIKLKCRDKSAELADTFIETQRVYPESGSSIQVEHLMQDIIDDNDPFKDAIAVSYTWNGTLVITTSDTSEVAVDEYIGYARGPFFKIASIVPNTSVTILNPQSRSLPTGSGAGVSFRLPGESRWTLYSVNGSAAVPFNPGDSPSWAIKPYVQSKMHVLEALKALTDQIGYVVQYLWYVATGDFQLVMYAPDRGKTAIDYTWDQGKYFDIQKLGMRRHQIRNKVKVVYQDAGIPTSYIASDAPSIDKYRLRAMEICEGTASQIDDAAEAQLLAEAALGDLKEPDATHGVAVPYFFPVELGDMERMVANGIHYSSDQDVAVKKYSHRLRGKGAPSTALTCRGKPAGGFMRWLNVEARSGVGPANDDYANQAAEGVTGTPAPGMVVVEYDDPRTMEPAIPDWAYTKCFVDTGSGFTPGIANLRAIGRQTRFEIAGLLIGTTYYIKLQIIDEAGNIAATTAQISVATEAIGPYHVNQEEERNLVNYNPNFGIHTKDETANEPDAWFVQQGGAVWADTAGDWYFGTAAADIRTGNRSVKLNSLARPAVIAELRRFETEYFLVDEASLYAVNFEWKNDGAGGGEDRVSWMPAVRFYDEGRNLLGGMSWTKLSQLSYLAGLGYTFGTGVVAPIGTWIADRGWFVPRATAKYAKFTIYVLVEATFTYATHPTIYFDRFNVSRSTTKFSSEGSTAINRNHAGPGNWLAPWLASADAFDQWSFDTFDAWTPGNGAAVEHEYEIQEDGEYLVMGHVTWSTMGVGSVMQARIWLNGVAASEVSPPIVYQGVGVPSVSVLVANRQYSKGDVLQIQGQHSSGVARLILDADSRLEVVQTTNVGIR